MSDNRTSRRIPALDRPPPRIRAEDYDDRTSGVPWRPAPGCESSPFVPCYVGSCERCTCRLARLIVAIAAAAASLHGQQEDVEMTPAPPAPQVRCPPPLSLHAASPSPPHHLDGRQSRPHLAAPVAPAPPQTAFDDSAGWRCSNCQRCTARAVCAHQQCRRCRSYGVGRGVRGPRLAARQRRRRRQQRRCRG